MTKHPRLACQSIIPATAISHAQIRDDRDFLIVLQSKEGGDSNLEATALWKVMPRPILAEPCS